MSSVYVRDQVSAFLTANHVGESQIELDGQYDDLSEILSTAGVTYSDNWLGLQYLANEENPITVGATNTGGTYREVGGIFLHVVEPARLGVAALILARADTLVNSFRGQRINDIIIDNMTQPNFGKGVTIEFEGGYQSAVIMLSYYRDLSL